MVGSAWVLLALGLAWAGPDDDVAVVQDVPVASSPVDSQAQPPADESAPGEPSVTPADSESVGVSSPAGRDTMGGVPGLPSVEAEYDRLFGGGEEAPAQITPLPEPADLSIPGWVWAIALLLVGAAVYLRRKKPPGRPVALSLVGRLPMGKEGTLAVVEVGDADGARRRLLVGFGGGAPRLVQDLGVILPADVDAPVTAADLAIGGAAMRAPLPAPVRPITPVEPITPVSPPSSAPGEFAGALARAEEKLPLTGRRRKTGGPKLEVRDDLIAEVLAERGDDDEPTDSSPSTYSFRGLMG